MSLGEETRLHQAQIEAERQARCVLPLEDLESYEDLTELSAAHLFATWMQERGEGSS